MSETHAHHRKHILRSAGIMGGATFLSRIAGLIRDALGGSILGSGIANDAYLAAYRIPNMLRDLFAEGALSTAFVPTYSDVLTRQGDEEAWRLTSAMINWIGLVFGILIPLAVVGAPWIVRVVVPGFSDDPEKFRLTIELTRIIMPFIAFMSLAALMMGVLNARRHFLMPALAPVTFNLLIIGFGIFAVPYFGSTPEEQAVGWTWGALLGGIGQFAIQVPIVFKQGFRYSYSVGFSHPGVRKIFKMMLPAVFALSVTQINLLINTQLASHLAEGSVTFLYYGNRLMQFPLGIFGVAVATALLPTVARQISLKQIDDARHTATFAIRMMLFILIPATVGLIVISDPLNVLMFRYGRFGMDAALSAATACRYYSIGLIAYAGVKVLGPIFYALEDPKTAVRSGVIAVAVNIAASLILMRTMGFRGLALATAIAAFVNFGLHILELRRRLKGFEVPTLKATFWQVLLASAVMGAVCYAILQMLPPTTDRQSAIAPTVLILIAGAVTYLGMTAMMRMDEAKELWKAVKKNPAGA